MASSNNGQLLRLINHRNIPVRNIFTTRVYNFVHKVSCIPASISGYYHTPASKATARSTSDDSEIHLHLQQALRLKLVLRLKQDLRLPQVLRLKQVLRLFTSPNEPTQR